MKLVRKSQKKKKNKQAKAPPLLSSLILTALKLKLMKECSMKSRIAWRQLKAKLSIRLS